VLAAESALITGSLLEYLVGVRCCATGIAFIITAAWVDGALMRYAGALQHLYTTTALAAPVAA
jgi:hypothetical protein